MFSTECTKKKKIYIYCVCKIKYHQACCTTPSDEKTTTMEFFKIIYFVPSIIFTHLHIIIFIIVCFSTAFYLLL